MNRILESDWSPIGIFIGFLIFGVAMMLLSPFVDAQSKSEDRPDTITLQDLSKVDELNSVKIQNLYLRMDSLQAQIALAQQEYNSIQNDKLPALVSQVKAAYKWDNYDFDVRTATFKLRKE